MYKLASFSYDVLDYVLNNELQELKSIADTIDKRANLKIPDMDEVNDMHPSDFALIINHPAQGEMRKFAKYGPEITELNIKLLAKNRNNYPDALVKVAATNLACAANEYGIDIPESLSEFKNSNQFISNFVDIDQLEKSASTIVEQDDEVTGPFLIESENKYQCKSAEDVTKAAEYFRQYHKMFNSNEKLEYTSNLWKEAEKHQIDLSETLIEKYAKLNSSELSENFQYQIQNREAILKDNSEFKNVYNKLLEKSASLSPQETMETLSELDQSTGAWSYWEDKIDDPLVATYAQEKKAQYYNGKPVTLEGLKSIDTGVLTEIVGTEGVTDLRSDSGMDVFNALPVPIKEEIVKYL